MTIKGLDKSAVSQGIENALGRPVSFEGISFSGKTDPQIFREIVMAEVARGGDIDEDHELAVTSVLEAYKEAARSFLTTANVQILPGATQLVSQFHEQEDVQLALLTGNVQEMAYLKLSQVSLDGYFPFGAFGCDAEDRNKLPHFALDRATTHTGQTFTGKDVVVIGDTPRDIECGKVIGATTVAVGTGNFSMGELAVHEPDMALETLASFQLP